jgi:hypothetical protein
MTDATPMPHHCHAIGCKTEVPRKMFMCGKHWKLVPMPIKQRIYVHYRPGQESGLARPTEAYLAAAKEARAAVAARTGVCTACGRLVGAKDGKLVRHPEAEAGPLKMKVCRGSGAAPSAPKAAQGELL